MQCLADLGVKVSPTIASQIQFISVFNFSIFLAFTICYIYQLYYILVVLTRKTTLPAAKKNHRFAAVISARNESAVIGDLIRSIKAQNYPSGLIDIFVIADNCTDNTAAVAREAGAYVFVRNNKELVGKGYALDYGFKTILSNYKDRHYEAFFIFDADNILDPNYFREMNKTFDGGAKVSTSFRNSKNFGSNWISAGYALWFLRESRFLNQARLMLNTSCAVSGTGFYIATEIIERAGGWKWHLLTEDIEFSTSSIIQGQRISYTPTAVLYDEQPVTFRDSWNQRFRWAKGFYQVFGRYGAKLIGGIGKNPKGKRFACYDMLMTIAPGMLLTIVSVLFNVVVLVLVLTGVMPVKMLIKSSLFSISFALFSYVGFMFFLGVLTTICEWNHIYAPTHKKILSMFTFPFFMLTYIPIALTALVKKCTWKPIRHYISMEVPSMPSAPHASESPKSAPMTPRA